MVSLDENEDNVSYFLLVDIVPNRDKRDILEKKEEKWVKRKKNGEKQNRRGKKGQKGEGIEREIVMGSQLIEFYSENFK